MEGTRTELQMIKMSEIQSQEVAWLWSVYPLREADDCAGRSGGWKDNAGAEYSGEAVKGRGHRQ